MYVAIEGIDTCGKSTQIELLKQYFTSATFTKEPGGSGIGEAIRDILLYLPQKSGTKLDVWAEFMLFLADRAQHYAEVLSQSANKLIISDRSVISGIAYAVNIPTQKAIELNRLILRDMLPNLVVILELDEASLKARIAKKSQDSIESRGISYMLDIQKRLFETTEALNIPCITINATQDREVIARHIVDAICAYMPR